MGILGAMIRGGGKRVLLFDNNLIIFFTWWPPGVKSVLAVCMPFLFQAMREWAEMRRLSSPAAQNDLYGVDNHQFNSRNPSLSPSLCLIYQNCKNIFQFSSSFSLSLPLRLRLSWFSMCFLFVPVLLLSRSESRKWLDCNLKRSMPHQSIKAGWLAWLSQAKLHGELYVKSVSCLLAPARSQFDWQPKPGQATSPNLASVCVCVCVCLQTDRQTDSFSRSELSHRSAPRATAANNDWLPRPPPNKRSPCVMMIGAGAEVMARSWLGHLDGKRKRKRKEDGEGGRDRKKPATLHHHHKTWPRDLGLFWVDGDGALIPRTDEIQSQRWGWGREDGPMRSSSVIWFTHTNIHGPAL